MTPEQHTIVVRTLLTGVVEHDVPIPVGYVPDDAAWRWVSLQTWWHQAAFELHRRQLRATYGPLETQVMSILLTADINCTCHHCKPNHAQS